IVKILGMRQRGQFFQNFCDVLYRHFYILKLAKDKILYFRSMQQLLRKIAFPISLVYALVVYLRNFLYDVGILTSRSCATPTICVGNLSVGGTGKTPMTEYLIRVLEGHRTAVLSRGYKRKSKGFL